MAGIERIGHETLFVEKHLDERYAVVTLDRPEKRNADNLTVFRELGAAVRSFDRDDEAGAVVLTGGGGKAFSAGADLGDMTFDDSRDRFDFVRLCTTPSRASSCFPRWW
jgi:enoyl-CoA hydratase/carnithine racemase